MNIEDVKDASKEMKSNGYRLLLESRTEPYGQIVTRFMSREGLLVGPVITTWLRNPEKKPP